MHNNLHSSDSFSIFMFMKYLAGETVGPVGSRPKTRAVITAGVRQTSCGAKGTFPGRSARCKGVLGIVRPRRIVSVCEICLRRMDWSDCATNAVLLGAGQLPTGGLVVPEAGADGGAPDLVVQLDGIRGFCGRRDVGLSETCCCCFVILDNCSRTGCVKC